MVDDKFLERLGIEKGTRKVVNHEERGRVLRAMDGCTYKAAAGGSLSNSLVALARLGSSRASSYPELRIAMAGSVGSDPLGSFYRQKLHRANVQFLSKPVKDGTTGTVIVLTTPDAQRTMLAYQGTSSTLAYDSDLAEIVSKSNLLIVEGYLFEFSHTIEAIKQACEDAKKNGALIAVSASDVSCIKRCHSDFWDIVGNYADILFANANEARAFCELTSEESTVSAARYLSHSIPLVSVTDGMHGSYIGVKGEAIYIPPPACIPVDTCGAGDAYASGILYGILRGASDLKGIGLLAAQVAAVVVGQQGTRLRVKDADRFPTYDISSPSSPKSSTGGGDGNYRGPKRAVPPSLEDLLSDCLVLPLRLRFYINAKPAPPSNSKMLEGPLFVTWKKATNGSEPRLRGCIGTLEPRQIVSGFKDYALTSALRDRRFSPIQSKELPYLECTVSILTEYETALNHLDWEVGKHGLIIEFTDPDYNVRRSGTYLPEVAAHEVLRYLAGWTQLETIDSLMRKAGYNGTITESLRKKIRVTRYQSTLYTMHYGEYTAYVKKNRGEINGAPIVNGFKPGQ
ncbi:unnamed protein product [Triticum turgidum subsp. durum]|uniref:AMMECR1 domain-containing protein n=1 Tax=Triticum turgidum subsp. durum TaxID=4567 RepID=A0A9R0QVM9_TRITD|nr:unnamed protein product [Triticum turgidum subsp. durum]